MANSVEDARQVTSSGVEFLHAVEATFAACEQLTDAYLARALAAGSMATYEHLGAVISYLDQASSCRWGCQGGDHASEQLIGRCANYSMGALRLARSGFYDEAITLIRSVGENTNLAVLFSLHEEELKEWRQASHKVRRKLFSPAAIRKKLEDRGCPIPIDANRYGQLSEKAIHVTPGIGPQMYNVDRLTGCSGTFQELGLHFCLAELAYPLGILALAAVRLCGLESNEHGIDLTNAGRSLSESVPASRERVNAFIPTYGVLPAQPNLIGSTDG
jgi:hypothetical protein